MVCFGCRYRKDEDTRVGGGGKCWDPSGLHGREMGAGLEKRFGEGVC